MRSDNSTLDDYGTVVAKPRAVGRALMQWMKGRARIRASGMMKGADVFPAGGWKMDGHKMISQRFPG